MKGFHLRLDSVVVIFSFIACAGVTSTSLQWDLTMTIKTRTVTKLQHMLTPVESTNSTKQLHKKSTHQLWRFYSKETPSLYHPIQV